MKKIVLLFFSVICLFIFNENVHAKADWRVGTVTCNYKNGNDEISITYYNVGAALGDAEVYYKVDYKKGDKKYCMTSAMIDKCDADTEPWMSLGIYNFDSNFKYSEKSFYSIKSRLTRREYNEEANFSTETLCSKGVLISDIGNDSMDDVIVCETTDTVRTDAETACDYTGTDLFTLEGKTIGVNSYAGSNDPNYTGAYNDSRTLQEKYCNNPETNPDYDAEKCAEATKDVQATITEAEKTGTTQAELENEYIGFKANIDLDFDTSKGCESYLGNPKDNVNKPPAYYLQFVFNLMKYIAIIMLLVLTIFEFAKAVASSNQDAMKKALLNTAKRLIIAIVIFLLPILIEFLFKVLGIYSSTTCGIK